MPADKNPTPLAVDARAVPPRALQSTYPEPYFSRMAGREKRALGDLFGLKVFGVNLTRLKPGGESALLHRHTRQDEFIFIVEGEPTLITEAGSMALKPGMCAGFPAGGAAHQLVNRSGGDVLYLEIGDRGAGDAVLYPKDDLALVRDAGGKPRFTHKDGTPY